ncbi:hypothetical protein [Marivita sp.]|uniref:hypothetical protein n=1 Tax=Marivita sp. TaxID=2003365 RepID=UPI003A87EA1A
MKEKPPKAPERDMHSQRIEAYSNLIKSIVWPLLALSVVLLFLQPLKSLLEQTVSVSVAGFELERDRVYSRFDRRQIDQITSLNTQEIVRFVLEFDSGVRCGKSTEGNDYAKFSNIGLVSRVLEQCGGTGSFDVTYRLTDDGVFFHASLERLLVEVFDEFLPDNE